MLRPNNSQARSGVAKSFASIRPRRIRPDAPGAPRQARIPIAAPGLADKPKALQATGAEVDRQGGRESD